MDSVNKTLYIPLYGKSFVSRRGLFFRDELAEEIWDREGFPLQGKAKSKWLAYYMGMRAAVFDSWLKEKMEQLPGAVILHLGCGMDSRVMRIGNDRHLWFDVDFLAVIAERKQYFSENTLYRMVSGDLRKREWMTELPVDCPAIVVMEGGSMYFSVLELQELLRNLSAHFSQTVVLMDTYTSFAARATKYCNPIHDVGVTDVFGFDSPNVLTGNTGFRFLREHDLCPAYLIRQLPEKERGFFRWMFAGKLAKKIYRLYEFEA